MQCAFCRKVLEHGVNVLGVQQGVLGPRGFVEIEERLVFCSDACVHRYFNGSDEQEADFS